MTIALTRHFRQRVHERLPGQCPEQLWTMVSRAIEEQREDLIEYLGRLDRKGRRHWRFRWSRDGAPCVVVVNQDMVPITVYREKAE